MSYTEDLRLLVQEAVNEYRRLGKPLDVDALAHDMNLKHGMRPALLAEAEKYIEARLAQPGTGFVPFARDGHDELVYGPIAQATRAQIEAGIALLEQMAALGDEHARNVLRCKATWAPSWALE